METTAQQEQAPEQEMSAEEIQKALTKVNATLGHKTYLIRVLEMESEQLLQAINDLHKKNQARLQSVPATPPSVL